jgi:hypothetical protein
MSGQPLVGSLIYLIDLHIRCFYTFGAGCTFGSPPTSRRGSLLTLSALQLSKNSPFLFGRCPTLSFLSSGTEAHPSDLCSLVKQKMHRPPKNRAADVTNERCSKHKTLQEMIKKCVFCDSDQAIVL